MSNSQYILRGTPVIDVPSVGNLVHDELGELVQARLNEEFKGTPIEDKTKYQSGQELSFSNIPRNLFRNQVLRTELSQYGVVFQTPFKVVQYWNLVRDPSTYADTNSVSVFPKEGPNEDLRKRVLDLIGKSSIEVPILVANLGVEKANNQYGFTFTESDAIQVIEAPFLQKDQRVRYDEKKNTLVPDEQGVQIYTPSDQSGLRRAFRYGDYVLDFRDVDLLGSGGAGRVPVFQNPQGRENFGELVGKLNEERDRQVAETQTKYAKAMKVLRTGKLQ